MTLDVAAALPEAQFTAWLNLVDLCALQPGETVLFHGGTSGVGSIALQLVRLLGATPYATAGSTRKCAACQTLGAKAAFNYRSGFAQKLRDATAGKGADVILDMSGGTHITNNLNALADDGRIAYLSSGGTTESALALLMRKRARMTGALLRALPLDSAAQAHAMLEAGQVIGKLLLRTGGHADPLRRQSAPKPSPRQYGNKPETHGYGALAISRSTLKLVTYPDRIIRSSGKAHL